MPAIVDEYMEWYAERGEEGWGNTRPRECDGEVDGCMELQVIDLFCALLCSISIQIL
jgi:hypothetical protein